MQAELHWVNREKNQEADDLTNEEFGKFCMKKRCDWGSLGPQWKVLDKVLWQVVLLAVKGVSMVRSSHRGGNGGPCPFELEKSAACLHVNEENALVNSLMTCHERVCVHVF